jgi:hypothetical protein
VGDDRAVDCNKPGHHARESRCAEDCL